MITTKGYAAQQPKSKLADWSFERRDIESDDVHIQILYCGVCHSDLHNINNHWMEGIFPMVPGHEIVGQVIAVGKDAHKFKAGDKVGVGTIVDSCGHCDDCTHGHEQFCSVTPVQTYNNLGRDGRPTYGGYSKEIVVREEFVHRISDKLDLAAAAPLLCAGITTYAPLKKWNVGKGSKLAVVGLGGLGHMGVKFGAALGADVTVISTSPRKEEAARKLGANHFLVSTDPEQMKPQRKFDYILDTVAQDHDINPYLNLLRTEGTYINVGLPPKPWEVSAFSVVVGNKSIAGSGVGGLKETQDMLDFCAEHNIVSEIELIKIQDIHAAYDRMERGDVRYRFVIDIASL